MLFVLMRYAAGGGNFIENRSSWCSNGGIALALYAQLWQLKGVSDADGFAALAAAEAVKIERNNCGAIAAMKGDSIGDGSDEAAAGFLIYNRR